MPSKRRTYPDLAPGLQDNLYGLFSSKSEAGVDCD